MKKSLLLIASCLMLFGCSSSITKNYPEVSNDFLESDYSELQKLSSKDMSYQDLCQKFIESKLNEEHNRVIKNVLNQGTLKNLQCKKTEDSFTATYKILIDDKETAIIFTIDPENYYVRKISADIASLGRKQTILLINTIEENEDNSTKIYSNISRNSNIESEIYADSSKSNYYYLPLESKELRIYTDKVETEKDYISVTDYWDNTVKQNEKDLEELEEGFKKSEELYGRP